MPNSLPSKETIRPEIMEALKIQSLHGVEHFYHSGLVTESELNEYIRLWNECPGRFTVAKYESGAIRNVLKRD